MSVLSYDRYVVLSGDTATASASVEAAIVEAEGLVIEFLRRPLAEGTYTDHLFVEYDGFVYPKAVPIASVPVSASYEVYDTVAIRNVDSGIGDFTVEGYERTVPGSYQVHRPKAAVTYTGGWTSASLPFSVARTIARLAYAIANPRPLSDDSGGATSKSLGDASVSYGPGGAAGDAPGRDMIEALAPGAVSALDGYRWTEDYA